MHTLESHMRHVGTIIDALSISHGNQYLMRRYFYRCIIDVTWESVFNASIMLQQSCCESDGGTFFIVVGQPEGPLSRVKKERRRRNTSKFKAKKERGLT